MGEQPAEQPRLVLLTVGGSTPMTPGRTYVVGRDPQCDIVFPDRRVAWRHAVLRPEGDQYVVEDTGTITGTYVDGRRVRRATVTAGNSIRLASATDGPVATLVHSPQPLPTSTRTGYRPIQPVTNVIPLNQRCVRIGRAPDNDVVVDDLLVSSRHAELRATDDGFEIADLHSDSGTYLNGHIVDRSPVGQGDIVGIGHSVFVLAGSELEEFADTGKVWLDVDDLVVTIDDRRLLDAVSFTVPERCLLAVIGPSGAGKSTLLNALTGLRPADEGSVRYDGRDLYREYAELRQRIGVVPQEDILHVQLTVRRALSFAARLRFPSDTAAADRENRVTEVIDALGLTDHAGQRISTLSGGQRKRVSVALELLTKPSLLFLDEPTSGLDPGMDRSMMSLLLDLAHGGRTVVTVTHSVLNLDVCDRLLVLAPGGRIAYFGPPTRVLEFLGFDSWPEAFDAFENDRDRDWAGEYRASPLHEEYIVDGHERHRPSEPAPVGAPVPALTLRRWFVQVRTLVRRYFTVIASDPTFLAIMILLPVVLGLMARALAGSALTVDSTINTLLILCVGAVLTGAANAVRELVKERVIYRRERAVGLPRSAYLFSKVFVLGVISVLQGAVLTLVALAWVDVDPTGSGGVLMSPRWEITIAVALLAFTAMMGGLLISAVVRREEVTMPLLVFVAIIQVIFCGALLPLDSVPGLEELSWFVPARWALGAMAGTLDLQSLFPTRFGNDLLFAPTIGSWLMDLGVLIGLSVVAGGVINLMLRRQEPAVMRRR
ncbi:ATP-binding cassette domain-containing protein [Rhodococcus sp. D2-41]|uniref:ATP-binding cassette domain-containing protein n=1 Tax=Speluncibacter jeojiensis TaxID=2710754 RepID=UPI00240F5BC8|nr:ATP-binding cassette domain-containing protein [Rhodococcus sp. D2-41]MDG3010510.1 ATP-binding cassette domain-containing protein [Rhodococcus sp. D2-41]